MKQIRKRLTYANVMSSLAVFLVLGGATAFAASQKIGANELKANSIKTGKIVKEAVTAGKIKASAVTEAKIAGGAITEAKIANDAVTGAKVKDGSLTGADIVASSLGTVPNAEKLGNVAAAEYAKSGSPASIPATLLGTWKNDPGRAPATFYKDSFGVVHLEGTVEGGGTFTNIFNLPPGYRPGKGANFLIYTSGSTPGGLFIASDDEGRVTFLEGDNSLVSLYGVSFKAEN